MSTILSSPSLDRAKSVLAAPRFDRRDLGPLTVGLLVVAQAVLWLLARPAGEPLIHHIGQLLGAESVLLLSITLVLVSTLPGVEGWFGGLDRAAIWHRRVAATGMLLLLPHVLLSSNPDATRLGPVLAVAGALGLVALIVWAALPRWRSVTPAPLRRAVVALAGTAPARLLTRLLGGYDRWRSLHRLTGLLVAMGFAHGVLDATTFSRAPLLRWSYLVVGGIGIGAYAYRELFVRFVTSGHDYRVDDVRRLGGGLTELVLAPVGQPLAHAPGQFALLSVEGENGWHRRPFTISSGSGEDRVRLVIKHGDDTRSLPHLVRPGARAVLDGPHGRFDRTAATHHQVWIAAGVGVTPFLSWARSLDEEEDAAIDVFLTAAGPSPFEPELRAIAAEHRSLRLHVVDTSRRPHLTPEEVLSTAGTSPAALSVYLCGPTLMVRDFERAVRHAGVPRTRVHRERFEWR